MTTNYHTPIAFGAAATSSNLNAPLSQLDTAIGTVASGVSTNATAISNLETSIQGDISDLIDGTTPFTAIDVNGGAIDNTVIGATTALAGTFTTLTATNTLTVSKSGSGVQITISASSGFGRNLVFQSSSSSRWLVQTNATTESGSNVGSDFAIVRFADNGTSIDAPLFINRASGQLTLKELKVTGTFAANGKTPTTAGAYGLPTGTATRTTFVTSTVTTAQLAQRVFALIEDLSNSGIINAT